MCRSTTRCSSACCDAERCGSNQPASRGRAYCLRCRASSSCSGRSIAASRQRPAGSGRTAPKSAVGAKLRERLVEQLLALFDRAAHHQELPRRLGRRTEGRRRRRRSLFAATGRTTTAVARPRVRDLRRRGEHGTTLVSRGAPVGNRTAGLDGTAPVHLGAGRAADAATAKDRPSRFHVQLLACFSTGLAYLRRESRGNDVRPPVIDRGPLNAYSGGTFSACRPFWPCVTSNSTLWPSSNDL